MKMAVQLLIPWRVDNGAVAPSNRPHARSDSGQSVGIPASTGRSSPDRDRSLLTATERAQNASKGLAFENPELTAANRVSARLLAQNPCFDMSVLRRNRLAWTAWVLLATISHH